MADFHIKQNDTGPVLQYTLLPLTDITGATVAFSMKDASDVVKIDKAACSIVNATLGIVSYAWAAADTDTAGNFEAEFQVTKSDTTIETFPNAENLSVVITDDIS